MIQNFLCIITSSIPVPSTSSYICGISLISVYSFYDITFQPILCDSFLPNIKGIVPWYKCPEAVIASKFKSSIYRYVESWTDVVVNCTHTILGRTYRESKAYVVLQDSTTTWTRVSVCRLSYFRSTLLPYAYELKVSTKFQYTVAIDLATITCLVCVSVRPQIDPPPAEGLLLQLLCLLHILSWTVLNFQFVTVFCRANFSLLIENSVWDFNLVGAVMSRVTLIY